MLLLICNLHDYIYKGYTSMIHNHYQDIIKILRALQSEYREGSTEYLALARAIIKVGAYHLETEELSFWALEESRINEN